MPRRALDSPRSACGSLSPSPSPTFFSSSSTILLCPMPHLQFLDEHFSQQSTWTSSARSADSPPPTTTRWSNRTHRRHRTLSSSATDLTHSLRYRLAIGLAVAAAVSYTRNTDRTRQPTDTLRPDRSGRSTVRTTSSSSTARQFTPVTAPPRPRQRSYTHLRAPAHTCTTPQHSSSPSPLLRQFLLGHSRSPSLTIVRYPPSR